MTDRNLKRLGVLLRSFKTDRDDAGAQLNRAIEKLEATFRHNGFETPASLRFPSGKLHWARYTSPRGAATQWRVLCAHANCWTPRPLIIAPVTIRIAASYALDELLSEMLAAEEGE